MSSGQIPGTNVPPISFPGISSGIDYNSIIQKLTSLTLSPTIQLNAQLATLNAANTELIKINGLFSDVQNALATLSDAGLFSSWSATSSSLSVATAQGIPSATSTPGVYTISKTVLATASSVASNTTAGHNMTDLITAGPYAGQASDTVPLADSYAAVTPSNGTGSAGSLTVDGVTVSYNVNTDSLQAILNRVQTAVQTVDAGFTATESASGVVSFQSTDQPIALGSASDQGNLLQVLKLANAQVNNTAASGSVTGTSNVGGINQSASLNNNTSAGFVTAVTSGSFTINGVSISVDTSTDNVASILAKINASSAGVLATYSSDTNQITLTSKTTGAQSIVVGAAGDTSNFLTAAGLTSAAGATTTIGTQAEVDVQTASGGTQKYFSNSNQVTTAIPGIQINLLQSSNSSFTITVAQDTSQLVNALNTFVSTYNTAITEINNATQAPVVLPAQAGSLPGQTTSAVGGGILYGNADVTSIKNQLTDLVSGFFGSNPSYDSLASIGLNLTSSFTQLTTNNNGSAGNNGGTSLPGTQSGSVVQNTSFAGTDGTFQALDTTKLLAALAANPSAVQAIFQGSSSLTTQVGSYLTGVTGFPTNLSTGLVGNIPTTSIIQNFENTNTNTITSVEQQIQQITDNANTQADMLRKEFVDTEGMMAQLQAEQQQLAGFFKSSGG